MNARTDPDIPDIHKLQGGGVLTSTSHHDTYDFIKPSQFNLEGRVAFISGASYGIGRTIAVSYAQAKISGLILAARGDLSETVSAVENAAKAASIPPPKVMSLKIDVADAQFVEASAAEVKKQWPNGIDIVVSNAGWLEPEKTITESDPEDWWLSMAINTKGPYLVGRSFIPILLGKRDGLKTILNMVSIGAHMIFPGMSAYNTAKLAVCRLVEYEDAEYADKGLVSLCMHPGGVKTNMGLRLPPEKQKMLTDSHELVSDTVVWCTAQKREWLGGRYVSVQWDMKQLEEHKDEIVQKDLLKVKLDFGVGWA
jgi:NAD(P)-dependent dehydrogenase (short-subunit alcohol dehydrogenase family)